MTTVQLIINKTLPYGCKSKEEKRKGEYQLKLQKNKTVRDAEEIKKELAIVKNVFMGTDKLLNQTQGELSQTQGELNQTRGELSQTKKELKGVEHKLSVKSLKEDYKRYAMKPKTARGSHKFNEELKEILSESWINQIKDKKNPELLKEYLEQLKSPNAQFESNDSSFEEISA